jgi:hypothetical protein
MVPYQRSVFHIHDILVRIQILGSVPLTNGTGSRILLFSPVTFKMPTKNNLSKFLCLSFFKVLQLYHSSKIKSHKDATKQNRRNQGFSSFFYLLTEGSRAGSVQIIYGPGSRRTKNIRIRNTGYVYSSEIGVKYIRSQAYDTVD